MSCGASLIRRPGIRNERGTQVGASRRTPPVLSMAARTAVGLAGAVVINRPLQAVVRGENRKALISLRDTVGKDKPPARQRQHGSCLTRNTVRTPHSFFLLCGVS